jgi:hypothetical protein
MERNKSGFMTTKGALTLLRMSGEYHAGKRSLPPEISALKQRIKSATRNAELFTARLRVVDEGMINDIVRMKLELDGLYARWGESEARS